MFAAYRRRCVVGLWICVSQPTHYRITVSSEQLYSTCFSIVICVARVYCTLLKNILRTRNWEALLYVDAWSVQTNLVDFTWLPTFQTCLAFKPKVVGRPHTSFHFHWCMKVLSST